MEVRTNIPLIRQQDFIMKSSDVDEKGTQDAAEEERYKSLQALWMPRRRRL